MRRLTLSGRRRSEVAEHFGVPVRQLERWCWNHRVPLPLRDPRPSGGAPTNPADIADRARELRRALDDQPSGDRPPLVDPPAPAPAPQKAPQDVGAADSQPLLRLGSLRLAVDWLRREVEQRAAAVEAAKAALAEAEDDLEAVERAAEVLERRSATS